MDLKKGKKGLIVKTWERCTSLGGGSKNFGHGEQLKSKSWPRLNLTEDEKVVLRDCNYSKTGRVDPVNPAGCFSVYVGYEKQRFVVKTGCLNHPLFLKLLEDAETEYGFKRNGPIELPCEVDDFLKILLEMDCDYVSPKCTFGKKSKSSYHLLTPPKLFSLNRKPWQTP